MDRSIYTALNSMSILRDNQSVTSQNLANVSVPGFQKDVQINFSSVYLDRDKGIDPRVMALQEPGGFDNTPGPMSQTGSPMDVAIDGNGFFIVQPSSGGKIAMSRRGDFGVSADGILTDGTGTKPLSTDLEPIVVPPYRTITISGNGIIEIEPLNGPVGQKVRVAQLATTAGSEVPLTKTIDGFVRPFDGTIPEPDNRALLLNGFLEGSNVKSVDELVAGIDQSRAYEVNVKFLTTAKEIDEATASLMRMPG
ncbi:flagellar hook-basal body complex protein [Alphaproteobacteria bacterium]|nr:flagellar hook-basal body complex protein [Alphaproteobacteria bacterium]